MLHPTIVLPLVLMFALGCGSSQPKPTEDALANYEAALEHERQLVERSGDVTEPQARLGLKLDALSSLAKRSLTTAVSQSIDESGTLSLFGKEVPLGWSSHLASVTLQPDDSCMSCLRVGLTLAGRWDLDLPIVKASDHSTTSRFSLVAPLTFEATNDGRVAVNLDTASIVNIGGFVVESKADKLPDKITEPLMAKLETLAESAATKWVEKLPPVRLFTIAPFDVGSGVELVPAGISYDIESKSAFFDIGTNVGSTTDLGEPLGLTAEDGASLTFAGALVGALLASKLQSGELPRRYDETGAPSDDGAISITIDDVVVTDESLRLLVSEWSMKGPGSGTVRRHELLLPLGGGEAEPPAAVLARVTAAANDLWASVHTPPLAAPGMSFGLGTQTARQGEGIVHSRWGLMMTEQTP